MRVLIPGLFTALLVSTTLAVASDPIVAGKQVQKQTDKSVQISFKPPTRYVESEDTAAQHGLVKYYKLPAPDGNSRSFFTVSFQDKSEEPDIRNLKEYVNVDLNNFKQSFPDSVIAKVKVQGIIAEKFSKLGFPVLMFMFQGNKDSARASGDSLTLFFETPSGYWSIVWTVPQRSVKTGFPVFEGFIQDMTVQKLYEPKSGK